MALYQSDKQKLGTSIVLQRFFIVFVLIPAIVFTTMYCKRIAATKIEYLSADASITNVTRTGIYISSHKVNPHYSYVYSYTCKFTDANGITQYGFISKTYSEEKIYHYFNDPTTIYYAPDFQSGDEVFDALPQKPGSVATLGYFSFWIIEAILILSNLCKQLEHKKRYGEFVGWRLR